LWTLPNGLRPLLYSRPTTGLEGKFSGEYNIAAAIIDGKVGFATFTDEMVNRPQIKALIERTTQHEDERCNVGENGEVLPNTFGIGTRGFIELIVTMKDGRILTEKVYASKGSAVRPLDWADVQTKFLDCAKEGSIDAGAAQNVITALQSLADVKDMRALVDTLARG
jgi:2-methylcitrate dehydratase PrpD